MTPSDTKASSDSGPSASSASPQTITNIIDPKSQSSSSFTDSDSTRTTVAPTPIITYPEFLTRKHRGALPGSLTSTRAIYNVVIYTLYISGALSAVALAVAQYYVNPMRDALSEARRDFAQHALKLLDDLNQRMRDIVTARGIKVMKDGKLRYGVIKASGSRAGKELGGVGERCSDSGSSDNDHSTGTDDAGNADDSDESFAVTEFYQRDVGTQTSPTIMSRRSSSQSAQALRKSQPGVRFQSPRPMTKSPSEGRVDHDKDIVAVLKDSILAAIYVDDSHVCGVDEVSSQIADLKAYLGRLTQAANFPVIGDERSRYLFPTSQGMGAGSSGGQAAADGGVDAAQELKTEIRRLKGYLLSARNFPVPGSSQKGAWAGKGR